MRKLFILLLFVSSYAGAQHKYQDALLYGKKEWRFQVLKDLGIPNDTIQPPAVDSANYKPHIASINGVFYLYNPNTTHWIAIGTSAINTAPPIYNIGDTIRLQAVPTDLGGTGQTDVGLPYQLLRTNAAATGTEWWTFRKYDYHIDSIQYQLPMYAVKINDTITEVRSGNNAPAWNADKLQNYDLEPGEPDDGATWQYSRSLHRWQWIVITTGGFNLRTFDIILLALIGMCGIVLTRHQRQINELKKR